MEIVRYVIVFLAIGWGGGVIGSVFFLVLSPLISSLRGTLAGRLITTASNGLAVIAAVYLAFLACDLTGGEAKYLMFSIAFYAMVSNDLWRLRRAKNASRVPGLTLEEYPSLRTEVVQTELFNFAADIVGFVVGLSLLPRLPFV